MCRTRMGLASREPHANGAEKHVFKCPKCEFSKTKITGDPTNAGLSRTPEKMSAPVGGIVRQPFDLLSRFTF